MLGTKPRQFAKHRKTFKDVLTPSQSKVMAIFLNDLLRVGEKAVEAGVKPDILGFADYWAERTKSPEEWKIEQMWQSREGY